MKIQLAKRLPTTSQELLMFLAILIIGCSNGCVASVQTPSFSGGIRVTQVETVTTQAPIPVPGVPTSGYRTSQIGAPSQYSGHKVNFPIPGDDANTDVFGNHDEP